LFWSGFRRCPKSSHEKNKGENAMLARRSMLGLTLAGLTAAAARAQSGQPLRIILPLQAGSSVDASTRVIADALAKALGQSVVIDNQPGAGGITGTAQIVRAAPDGNTIGVISTNHAVNPAIYHNVPFDSVEDITPITMIGTTPLVLLAHPSLGVSNVRELVALAKTKPGAINYGSSGNGTILHLAVAMLTSETGISLQHVPYRGANQFLQDLISGQIQLGVFGANVAATHIKSGALKALGVTPAKRTELLPDVPTIAEQGVAGYDIVGWFAAIGPKNMKPADVARLNAAFATALADPMAHETLVTQGNAVTPSTPQAAAALLREEVAKYAKLVKKAGIKLE
jgi:tripartite-type tricarboxylate transporter receptor subunit TctC